MGKKYLASLFLTGFVLVALTGCQTEKETASQQETQTLETEQQIVEDEPQIVEDEPQTQQAEITEDADDTKESYIDICSLCETEQICGTYTAEGQEYVVCHDCSNEFTTAFAETADKQSCSLCQLEKICGTYIVDGEEYIVCPDDFEEFSYGMNLIHN